MNLELVERMALGKCQLCGSYFGIGAEKRRYANVARENFSKKYQNGSGLMFWNRELSHRKAKLGLRVPKDGSTFERRFICPDCVENVLAEVASTDILG
jgi:transcription elongation factor Elf1